MKIYEITTYDGLNDTDRQFFLTLELAEQTLNNAGFEKTGNGQWSRRDENDWLITAFIREREVATPQLDKA